MATDAKRIAGRVKYMLHRDAERDQSYNKVLAIRDGDYDTVAPGLFPAEFDKPLIANFIDTAARDISEVMAPLPMFNCEPASQKADTERKRAEKRSAIVNAYVQNSRLRDQMYEGADRYATFGFMSYVVEPDFGEQTPVIRVDDSSSAHYCLDYRGRVKEYAVVYTVDKDQLKIEYPELAERIENLCSQHWTDKVKIVRWYDDYCQVLMMVDQELVLDTVEHPIGRCPVRVVQRPTIAKTVKGQFDDVIWVQVARAMVQMYTMNALEQSVNSPIVGPEDVQEIELGPLSYLGHKDGAQAFSRLRLDIVPGLFPETEVLAREQRAGARVPEARSGSIDASIVTGQGVQALMGTFDTQIQTFQQLNAGALEDVASMCLEMDEALWPNTEKSVRVKDSGSPKKITYTPAKDINGDYSVDVSYGAIAGLDPNRGLVFLLQALAGGLISKSTSRKHLPVELNVMEEERLIDLEQSRDSLSASVAALAQAIPGLAAQGQDPRELVLQLSDVMDRRRKGDTIEEAVKKVFAPKEKEEEEPADPLEALMQQAGGGPPGGAQVPGGGGGAQSLLMSLAGMTPGGNPNLQSTVSRRRPV